MTVSGDDYDDEEEEEDKVMMILTMTMNMEISFMVKMIIDDFWCVL